MSDKLYNSLKPIVGILVTCTILVLNKTWAQNPITNVSNRNTISLNGTWKYLVDPYETGYYDYRRDQRDQKTYPSKSEAVFLGYKQQHPSERVEYNFELAKDIRVPGDWNSQVEKLYYYEGSVWYYKSFDWNKRKPLDRQFIYFGAVNYEADVYLNGEKLGQHVGGFTAFNFEITEKLREGKNFIIVKVDNTRSLEKVPTINTDWWNYGGITRDVKIINVPNTFIRDYYVQLAKGTEQTIEVWVQLDGPERSNQTVELTLSEAGLSKKLVTDDQGWAKAMFEVKQLELWSPKAPKYYEVKLSHRGDSIMDQIGFRSLEVKGQNILLNGKSIFLRGISIHEEIGLYGRRAYSEDDARTLLGWAKDLGCNFVRLAHYPHNENMTKVADELGIMVWSEVPVYWTIQWKNESTFLNAQNQLKDMIARDKNRASVIVWSVANETPISQERTQFLKKMIATAKEMDQVRLVSAALERHTKKGTRNTQVVEDPLQEFVDVIAFNEYIGWYDGLPEKCKTAVFDIEYNKPIIISEFGGGALQGYHGPKTTRWTEEFQEDLYIQTLDMLDKIPQLRGMTPWILTDFRSPRRILSGIQDDWNRKGIMSEKGEKKKAFYILQKYYQNKKKQYQD